LRRRRAAGRERQRIGDGLNAGATGWYPYRCGAGTNLQTRNVYRRKKRIKPPAMRMATQTTFFRSAPAMIEALLATVLAGETELQPGLATYNNAPAIFTSKVPEDAPRPALHLHCEVVRPFDFRERIGFTLQVRIRVLGSAEQFNLTALRGLAWQVFQAL